MKLMQVTWIEVTIISTVFSLLIAIISYLAVTMHKQAMLKFDQLINTVGEIGKDLVSHDEQLKAGNKEFQKIEDHQRVQDGILKDHNERIIRLETREN